MLKYWIVPIMLALAAKADTVSFTGMLSDPTDTFSLTVVLADPGTLTLQTYGFGGGTNAAGQTIESGGFDPLLAVFAGMGDSAALVEGTSDILTNFTSFLGCPPAGTELLGRNPGYCGDITMSLSLAAGTYTVLLSDAAYLPLALFAGPEAPGTLGDGFADLTGGAFQTCFDAGTCKDDTGHWALDVTAPAASTVPEPSTLALTGLGLLGALLVRKIRKENS